MRFVSPSLIFSLVERMPSLRGYTNFRKQMGRRSAASGAHSPTKCTSTKGTNSSFLYINFTVPFPLLSTKITLDCTSETFSEKSAPPRYRGDPSSQSLWYTPSTQGSCLLPIPSRVDSLGNRGPPPESSLYCPLLGPLRAIPRPRRYPMSREQTVR